MCVSGKVQLRGFYSVLFLMISDIIHNTNMTLKFSYEKYIFFAYTETV